MNFNQIFNPTKNITKNKHILTYLSIKPISKNSQLWMFTFCLFFLIKFTFEQASISPQLLNDNNLQKRILTILTTNSGSSTATVLFDSPAVSTPSPNYVFTGIASLQYDQWYSNNQLIVNFGVAVQIISTSQLTYVINYHLNNLKLIKLSMLLFQNQWTYIFGIQSYTMSGNGNYGFSGTSLSLFLFTQMVQVTTSTSSYIISYQTSYTNPTTSNYNFNLNINGGSYTSTSFRIKVLAINNVYFTSVIYPVKYYSFTFSTNSGTGYQYSNNILKYEQNISGHLFGIGSFSFMTSSGNYPTNNFKINTQFLSPTNLKVTNSNQFSTLYYIIINFYSYGCPNINFPVRLKNGVIDQCYQYCPIGYYQIYQYFQRMNICKLCTVINCLQCKASNYCIKCIDYYVIVAYTTFTTCVLKSGYFINGGLVYQCNLYNNGCQKCSLLTSSGVTKSSCTLCKQGYIISISTTGHYICKPCSFYVPNCAKCQLYLGSIICQSCILSYFLINQTTCSLANPSQTILTCFDPNCLKCKKTNPNVFFSCKYSNFVLLYQVCRQIICSDYKIDPIQSCDDGNNLNFDGCSSQCKIQKGYNCVPKLLDINVPDIWVSDCYFINQIKIKVVSINKYVDQNKLKIILKVSQPNIKQWASFTQQAFSHIIKFDVPRISSGTNHYKYKLSCKFISILKPFQYFSYDRILQESLDYSMFNPSDYQYLQLEIEYILTETLTNAHSTTNYESLNHQSAIIQFHPQLSNLLVFRSNIQQSITLQLISTNNQLIQYYDQQYHLYTDIIYMVSIGISIIVWMEIVFGIVLMFVEKRNSRIMLIALENAFITQLTYYSISQIGELNPYFLVMAEGLKYSSGFDVKLSSNHNYIVQNNIPNKQVAVLGSYTIYLSDNINISILLILVFFGIGLILLLISKFKKHEQQIQPQQQNNKKQNNNDNQENENQNKINSNKSNINANNNPNNTNLKNTSTPTHNSQSSINLSSIFQLSQIFIYNFSFCLLLFFLYKILIYSFFQFQHISQSQSIDYVILSLLFLFIIIYCVLLYKKIQMFNTLTDKIKYMNKNDIMKDELDQLENSDMQQKIIKFIDIINMNIKRIYLYSFIIQHIVNSITIVFISQLFICWNIIPIIINISYIYLISQSHLYNQSNKIRLFINQIIFIFIQLLFMIRQINIQNVQQSIGGQQSNLGIYLAVSIIGLLWVSVGVNLAYFMYSIKKIRCCVLEADWEKIDRELVRRLKSMKHLKEEKLKKDNQLKLNQFKQNYNINQNQIKQQILFQTIQFQSLQRQQFNHQNQHQLNQTHKQLQLNPLLSHLINLNFTQRLIRKPSYQTKNIQKQQIIEQKWPQIQQKQLYRQIKIQIKQTLMRSKFTPFGDSLQRTIAQLKKQKQKLKNDKYQYTNRKLYIMDQEYDNI